METVFKIASEENVRVWTGDQYIDMEIQAMICEIAEKVKFNPECSRIILDDFFINTSKQAIVQKLKWLKSNGFVIVWYDPYENEIMIEQ